MTLEQRAAIVQVAMRAATDSEWGYESEDALAALREVDPEYDWSPELLQAELEAGHRRMGPLPMPRPLTGVEEMVLRESLSIFQRQCAFVREVSRPIVVGSTVHVRAPARYSTK